MLQDLIAEISRVRHVLRKAVAAGLASPEVDQALERMRSLAHSGEDPGLLHEYHRWCIHRSFLRSG